MKAFQAAHQQEQQLKVSKSTTGLEQHLKWADTKVQQPARVKSLAEIQAEEQELTAKVIRDFIQYIISCNFFIER